jgi:hypothetical protein
MIKILLSCLLITYGSLTSVNNSHRIEGLRWFNPQVKNT